jgi:hypothetical protein
MVTIVGMTVMFLKTDPSKKALIWTSQHAYNLRHEKESWCFLVDGMLHHDALQYKIASRNPFIIKEIYQEWWFFEVLDSRHDLKFMANCSINNPAELDGPLPKGCDIASAITIGEVTRSTGKEDSFMNTFTASSKSLDVNIGGKVFFKGIDDTRTRFWGTDPGTGVSFDLMFERNLPPWKKRKTRVGSRFLDHMWYLPAMPSAIVNGKITFEGKDYPIERGIGYHDHFWGSPTQFRWAPWVTINDPAFEIISVVVPSSSDFSGACLDRKSWIDLGKPAFQPVSWVKDTVTRFEYPKQFTINAQARRYKLDMTVSENGSHASFDGGMGEYTCPIIWSWNYLASGKVSKKEHGTWKIIKNFDAIPASVYYWANFDFVALAKQAGIDISDYERFLK